MHGDLAPLPQICDLAEQYDALVMVDDSHATGFFGETGRGTPEYFGVKDRIDIITSTMGKTLGGASGGFTSGRAEIIAMLRQRSRPYLFSNSVAPPVVFGTMKAFELIDRHPQMVKILADNTKYFRDEMTRNGFQIKPGVHPIVPIMLGDEKRTVEMARQMNSKGIFVVGFSYPVVPKGEARIRVQISAIHTREQLDKAIRTFTEVGKALQLI
jgi:glycine C-acetyltransferase